MLTKDDYVIICGDFGAVWDKGKQDKYLQDWYNSKPWTTLFVGGNHDNYDALDAYPVEIWNNGKVHKISDSIIHLMNGQVFNIEGKTFFTMGGAESTDKWLRTEGISWWAREMPSKEEYEEAIDNLEKHDFKVDYVLTHCAPEGWIARNSHYVYDRSNNELTQFFFHLLNDWKIEFKHWYFGHYHGDEDIQEFDRPGEPRFHLRYQVVQELKE